MKKVLFTLLFISYWGIGSMVFAQETATSIHHTTLSTPSPIVYVYAELVYQKKYGVNICWVDGATVSPSTAQAVSQSQYSSAALDLMGKDGWELVTSVTRNFDGGFEIYFYLRKVIE